MDRRNELTLMESIINGDNDIKVIEILKNIDIALDERYYDYELLKTALKKKRIVIAHILIWLKGCRVRNPNKVELEETPLHLAMKLKDTITILTLLKEGASIYNKNSNGETPLLAAFNNKYFKAVDELLHHILDYNLSFNPDNKDDVIHFHIACLRQDIESVKVYLASGFDVNSYLSLNSREFSGLTPLHYLISQNENGAFFEFLLNHSDLTVKNGDGLTPLHSIFYNYDDEWDTEDNVGEFLSNIEFNNAFFNIMTQVFKSENNTKFINAVDSYGVSHFQLCCSIGISDFVEKFINNGADVNDSTSLNCSLNAGFTPLHFAVKYVCKEVVELLLKNGADPNRPDKNGMTPLHMACQNINFDEAVQIIDKLLDYSDTDKLENTVIHLMFNSVSHNILEEANIFDKLLSKVPLKINNLTDKNGLSLLHIFCTTNDTNRVNNLLDLGAEIDSASDAVFFCGYTPLHYAVAFNQKDIVELLLKRGAQVDVKTQELCTPLYLACQITRLKFNEIASEYEKLETDEAQTLDWITNRTNQLEIIRLLLEYGADVNAKDENGFTPLLAAYYVEDDALLDWSDELNKMAIIEINTRLMKITNILLSNKANINVYTINEQRSIFHIIGSGYLLQISDKIMECLIRVGADINATDKNGLTPLHLVAERSKYHLVKSFIKYKANIHAKCNQSQTPLEKTIEEYIDFTGILHLEEVSYKSTRHCVKILLESGSNVNIRTQGGSSLLHEATSCSRTFLVETLLYYGADINLQDSLGNTPACSLFENGEINRIDVACTIFIHIQKLLALGLYVNDKVKKFCNHLSQYCKNLEARTTTDKIERIYNECNSELDRLKSKKLDSYTSLYNILLKDPHELSKYVKSRSLINILEENTDKQFPLYSYLLKLQYKKGLLRSDILKDAKTSISHIAGLNLPDLCCDLILKYLTDEEIVNLKTIKTIKSCLKRKLNDNDNEMEPSIKSQKNE